MLNPALLTAVLVLYAGSVSASPHNAPRSHHRQMQVGSVKTFNASDAVALEKRQSSFSGVRMTWYPTDTGADACTGKNHLSTDWVVAMDFGLFGDGSACCGRQIQIAYGGKTAVATCVDECASCYNHGELDLTEGLFTYFVGDPGIGVFDASWVYADGTTTTSTSTHTTPTTTSTTHTTPTTTSTHHTTPTTTSTYVAPTTSSTYVEPTTSSTYVAPTTTSSTYVAPTTTSSTYVAPTTTSTHSTTHTTPTTTHTTSTHTTPTTTSTHTTPTTTHTTSTHTTPTTTSTTHTPTTSSTHTTPTTTSTKHTSSHTSTHSAAALVAHASSSSALKQSSAKPSSVKPTSVKPTVAATTESPLTLVGSVATTASVAATQAIANAGADTTPSVPAPGGALSGAVAHGASGQSVLLVALLSSVVVFVL
ncbi:unnamed protein product [Mycena citricolor]|uniref:Expansin family protein n=1 Tax=Mycena citricolor TaxID=2018698 RepID=A0AAD2H9S2_9AGAR|nr:unnamed protein product [Mycena citricolor]